MNEKIEELYAEAKQATKIGRMNAPIGVVAEKFAELIVKETLQVARAGIAYGDGMEDAVYKYFGVDE